MYACIFACLHEHIGGWKEWEEFPACLGISGWILVMGAGPWLSWSDCQSPEAIQQVLRNINIPYACGCFTRLCLIFYKEPGSTVTSDK